MATSEQGKRARRFPISLPLLKEIRLSLWAYTRGVSKTRMAEAIVIDRVSANCNWDEVCRDLKQEAAIKGLSPSALIAEILADDYKDAVDVGQVKWDCLLDGIEPQLQVDGEEEDC